MPDNDPKPTEVCRLCQAPLPDGTMGRACDGCIRQEWESHPNDSGYRNCAVKWFDVSERVWRQTTIESLIPSVGQRTEAYIWVPDREHEGKMERQRVPLKRLRPLHRDEIDAATTAWFAWYTGEEATMLRMARGETKFKRDQVVLIDGMTGQPATAEQRAEHLGAVEKAEQGKALPLFEAWRSVFYEGIFSSKSHHTVDPDVWGFN